MERGARRAHTHLKLSIGEVVLHHLVQTSLPTPGTTKAPQESCERKQDVCKLLRAGAILLLTRATGALSEAGYKYWHCAISYGPVLALNYFLIFGYIQFANILLA